jgi:hypothetical protein
MVRTKRLKRHIPAILFPLLCLSVLLKVGWCSAATFTWNGSVSSDWFNKTNWTPVGVPASTDTINITNGAINLTNSVRIQGVFNWAAGTLSGQPLAIASGGGLNISGAVTLENVLTNAGTVTMTGAASVTIYNDNGIYLGGVYNLVGALWDIQTNASINCACFGPEFFNNAGTFRKSVSAGAATVNVNFTNTATVTNLIGVLNFDGGGTLTGTYGTVAGATIDFGAGNFTMGVPPIISGLGLCEFTGGLLTLTQNVPTNLLLAGGNLFVGPAFQGGGGITNLTLNGGTLISTNSVAGTFTCNGGIIAGPLTIKSGGLLNISGAVTLENVLTNAGTVTMTGAASVTIYNDSGIYLGGVYNQAGALWDIQTNANINCACFGPEFFNNAGTFRKSVSTGTATVSVNFTNTATVTNLIGILTFDDGGNLAGTYGTAAGATIDFASGNFTMGAPPTISGLGLCEFTGGLLTLTQNVPTNLVLAGGNLFVGPAFQGGGGITNLTLNGGTLISTNSVAGTFTCNGGIIAGLLTIKSGGLLNVTGAVTLENILTNAGTVTMTGAASVTIYNDSGVYLGGVYNLAGALWDIQTNANINCACFGPEFFNNAGTFRKSVSTGTATVGVSFTNTATINAQAGILSFSGNFTTTGGTLAFGVSGLGSFGQINVVGSVALNGTANVSWLNGFVPAVGNSFALLDYGSQSGTFANITFPPGILGQGIYSPTVFSVMITNITAPTNLPVFLSIKLVNTNTAVISWPSAATNYTLQTSTNLSSGSWSNITSGITTVSTNDVLSNNVNSKAGFFRLQSP